MDFQRELAQAVEKNSLPRIEELLAAGARPSAALLSQVHPRRDDIRIALVLGGADAAQLGLLWAVGTGRLDVVDRLLAAGFDPDAGNRVTTPLVSALEKGHAELALRLLAAGANPSLAPEFVKRTPVFQAVASNLPQALRALLAAGGDAERPFLHTAPDEQPVETPPLVLAARLGQAECVRALLEAAADVGLRDGLGRSAFEVAGDPEVRALLGSAAPPLAPDEELLRAAEAGAGVEAALARGASVEARDERESTRGWTPLQLAAANGHLEAVRALLAAGADPARTDLVGKPHAYLSYLYREGGEEGVRLARAALGRTALMRAAAAGHAPMCELLGGPVEARDGVGMTAFLLAVENGHLPVVERLVAMGADPRDKKAAALATSHAVRAYLAGFARGKKPGKAEVARAVEELDLPSLRTLVERGADLRKAPYLHAACAAVRHVQRGMVRSVKAAAEDEVLPVVAYLLERGVDVNAQGRLGTPLMASVHADHRRVIALLVAAGADPAVRDKAGSCAVDIAERYGRTDLFGAVARPAPAEEESETRPELTPFEGFAELVAQLAARCGNPAAEFGPGFRCPVRVALRAGLDLAAVQDEFLARGAFVFDLEHGREGPYELAILPTRDPLDAVALLLSSEVVEFLRALPVPVRLTNLRHDLLEGRLLAPVPDPKALAKRCLELCPDLEEGGLAGLTRELKKGRLFFWWD